MEYYSYFIGGKGKMLGWLSEMFEKMCSACVIINFVICGVAGGIIGDKIGDKIGNGEVSTTLLCFIVGLTIAFFTNVMNFGFLAQIIEIRKKVDLLSKNSGN